MKKNVRIKLLVCIFMLVLSKQTYAKIEELNVNYTNEYKNYMSLSDEEKEKCEVIPRKYTNINDTIDIKNKTLTNNGKKQIPEKFNLKDEIYIKVENQGMYGLCWAFASLESLETNLALKGYYYDFSELHLDYMTSNIFGGDRELHTGGFFDNFKNYVKGEHGPVDETDVPYYNDYDENDYDTLSNFDIDINVGEIVQYPPLYSYDSEEVKKQFRDNLKTHIMENGSLYAVICTPEDTEYMNYENYALYYDNENIYPLDIHAISIVGWDDNYSKDNFNSNHRPEHDGAYIALNSWGEEWGNDGYFYISYEDAWVGKEIGGVISATSKKQTECKDISFKDVNMYNAIKEVLGKRVVKYDDENLIASIIDWSINDINELDLSSKNIKDITGLEQIENLYNLNLTNNQISNVDIFREFKNLNILNLSKNNIGNIEFLKNIENLGETNLSYNGEIELTNLSNLQETFCLNLTGNKLKNLEKLKFPNDGILYLDKCNLSDNDLSLLQNLMLSELYLRDNDLKDISKLTSIKCMELNLSDNKNIDISTIPVEQCKAWEELSIVLRNCNIRTINNLPKTKYSCIDFSDNPIRNVDDIANYDVIILKLSNTKVKNLSKLKNISELEMMDCNLDSLDMFIELENLDYLNVDNNNICEIPKEFEKRETIISINNNNLCDIPIDMVMKIEARNQIITKDVEVIANSDNKVELPNLFKVIYEYDRENTRFKTENCSMDKDMQNIIINPSQVKNGVSKVMIDGTTVSGSKFIVNYVAIANDNTSNDKKEDNNNINDNIENNKNNYKSLNNEDYNKGDENKENSQNYQQNSKKQSIITSSSNKDNSTTSDKILPKTGFKSINVIAVAVMFIIVLFAGIIKYKKL